MQITLCEDDAVLNNGKPLLVVVVVQFDNGIKKRIPYPAANTISDLYMSLNKIAPNVKETIVVTGGLVGHPQEHIMTLESPQENFMSELLPIEQEAKPEEVKASVPVDKSTTIEKEDIVKIIKLNPRGDGDTSIELAVGMECRVLKVHKSGVVLPGTDDITDLIRGYDVVNDKAARPERTFVLPDEVQLSRKRKPAPKVSKAKIEEILKCPHCGTMNACALEDGKFKGTCEGCKGDYAIERIIVKCKTKDCKNDAKETTDIALFKYDGLYQGTCNVCKTKVEKKGK
jgi:hypothetical protein